METDGHRVVVEEEATAMAQIARENGAISVEEAADEAHAVRLATARRSAFSALARIRPTTILEDVTVPRSRLVEIVAFVEEVAERHQLQIATFGHFVDGNVHPTILTDETDHEEMERVELARSEFFDYALSLKRQAIEWRANPPKDRCDTSKHTAADLFRERMVYAGWFGDFINHEVYPKNEGEGIPESQRIPLPTEALANAWSAQPEKGL